MNLQEWRAQNVAERQLPSGLHVKLKKISIVDVMVSGSIPTMLYETVDHMAAGQMKPSDLVPVQRIIDVMVRACLIEPALAPEGQPGDETHLNLDELNIDDKMAIFNWANEGVMALRSFRDEQGSDVESVRDEPGLRDAAVGAGGDHGRVDGVPDRLGSDAPRPQGRKPARKERAAGQHPGQQS